MISCCLRILFLFAPALAGVMLSPQALAADTPKAKKKAKVAATSESIVEPSSSQQIRQSHKFGVDALYTPLSDFVLSYGASVRYHLEPHLSLELTGLLGNATVTKNTSENGIETNSNAKINGMAVYGAGRYFFGNSFNATAGLGLRTATVNYTIEETSIPITLNGKIDIQSIVLPIFIGNRWSFDSGFTIGCDWVGVMVALSGSAKSSIDGNIPNNTAKELNDDILDTFTALSRKSSLTVLLTSIGWAF